MCVCVGGGDWKEGLLIFTLTVNLSSLFSVTKSPMNKMHVYMFTSSVVSYFSYASGSTEATSNHWFGC